MRIINYINYDELELSSEEVDRNWIKLSDYYGDRHYVKAIYRDAFIKVPESDFGNHGWAFADDVKVLYTDKRSWGFINSQMYLGRNVYKCRYSNSWSFLPRDEWHYGYVSAGVQDYFIGKPNVMVNCNGENYYNREVYNAQLDFERDNDYRRSNRVRVSQFDYKSVRRIDKSGDSRYAIGLEIEQKNINSMELEGFRCAQDLYDKTGWANESDCTVDRELISPTLPFSLEGCDGEISSALNDIRDYLLKGEYDRSCGGHIHLSDKQTRGHNLRMDIQGFFPVFYALYPDRVENYYCEASDTSYMLRDDDKFCAFRDCGNRIEVRIFPAHYSTSVILWRLQLLRHVLRNRGRDLYDVYNMLSEKTDLRMHIENRIGSEEYVSFLERFKYYAVNYSEAEFDYDYIHPNYGREV